MLLMASQSRKKLKKLENIYRMVNIIVWISILIVTNTVESLSENKNNNAREQFNAVLNKHVAGKRINFSQRVNHNVLINAAAISFNSKGYLRYIHKKLSNFSPGKSGEKHLKRNESGTGDENGRNRRRGEQKSGNKNSRPDDGESEFPSGAAEWISAEEEPPVHAAHPFKMIFNVIRKPRPNARHGDDDDEEAPLIGPAEDPSPAAVGRNKKPRTDYRDDDGDFPSGLAAEWTSAEEDPLPVTRAPPKIARPKDHYDTLEPMLVPPLPLETDMSPEEFETRKRQFLAELRSVDFERVEIDTRPQFDGKVWYRERKVRLTASAFGRICKMKCTTSCKTSVYQIMYAPRVEAIAMHYGNVYEPIAREKAEELMHFKVDRCGLFIDTEYPYLAASPDGTIGDDCLIEIKCPFTARGTNSAIQAVEDKLLNYCVIDGDSIKLKTNYIYYYQIMGQMRISKRYKCYFVIYTPNWISIEVIHYNKTFWETNMMNQLKTFYMECLLPEIIDPMYPKRLVVDDIKDPIHIIENIKNMPKKKKKTRKFKLF